MSELTRADAVVLRTMKYRDSSLIVTLFTREFGKISGIVKGARKSKSGYGTTLQPMTRIRATVYRKEGRDLQTIGQWDVIDDVRHVQEQLPKLAAGMKIVELVQMIAHEEENDPLYELLVGALAALGRSEGSPENLFVWFEVSLCAVLGFELTLRECISCQRKKSPSGRPGSRLHFHVERGGVLCDACAGLSGEKTVVRRDAIDLLERIVEEAEPERVMALPVGEADLREMESLLWSFLRRHVAGIRPLKSERVFAKILPDS